MQWRQPSQTRNFSSCERRCGVEIEYIGVSLQESAAIIADLWHGKTEWQHNYHATVSTPDLGAFTVELDVKWMQRLSEQAQEDRRLSRVPVAETADKMLSPMVSAIAPNEIVTPPVPFSRLHELDKLVDRLRDAGAKGTGDSFMYAFGVHLNPETPSEHAYVLLQYLRAFIALYEWMKHAMRMDSTRVITGFAKGFPVDYARLIMSRDYTPNISQLMDDYLRHNPTRNRALDMLPLFAHIDGKRVRAVVKDELVKSRPTFHFRLPDCHIDRPDWQLSHAWDYWMEVECLANDEERLRAMQEDFLKHHESPLYLFSDAWRERTRQWLRNDHA